MTHRVRVAVRGLLMREDRLLVVNAWPTEVSDLWCAPGGGVEPHTSLPENLVREIKEETGLEVTVGPPVLVNEFHDPERGFHQVDVYFRVTAADATLDLGWTDPEGIVTERRFVTRDELAGLRVKPSSLAAVAWGDADAPAYDPLEPILR